MVPLKTKPRENNKANTSMVPVRERVEIINGPTLAPVSKIKEYNEMAVALSTEARFPIKVMMLGIRREMDPTKKMEHPAINMVCG
jgi:hypothetical protein